MLYYNLYLRTEVVGAERAGPRRAAARDKTRVRTRDSRPPLAPNLSLLLP